MKKTAITIMLIVLLPLALVASEEEGGLVMKRNSTTLNLTYQGLFSDDAPVHSVGAGFNQRMSWFGLPLFSYVDGAVGYPFVRTITDAERSLPLSASLATGIGWAFRIGDRLSMGLGAGVYMWGNFDTAVNHEGAMAEAQVSVGVDILAELRYHMSDTFYLALTAKPNVNLMRFGGTSSEEYSDSAGIVGGAIEFQPQVSIGVGMQYGRPLY